MARYCWAKRESFGSQIESLQGVRDIYPNDLNKPLATVCDRGCNTTCDSRNVAYSGAQARDKDPIRPSDPLRTGAGAGGHGGDTRRLTMTGGLSEISVRFSKGSRYARYHLADQLSYHLTMGAAIKNRYGACQLPCCFGHSDSLEDGQPWFLGGHGGLLCEI